MSLVRTKDEKFIISLYEFALKSGDIYGCFDKYKVGENVHLNPKAVNAISKLLLQANFIKKSSENEIFLTKNGEELALRLLQEKL